MFVLGSQLVDPRESRRVFAAAAAISGLISGVIPALGSRRPRTARWLLLISLISVAVSLGLLTRMIIRGFQHLG